MIEIANIYFKRSKFSGFTNGQQIELLSLMGIKSLSPVHHRRNFTIPVKRFRRALSVLSSYKDISVVVEQVMGLHYLFHYYRNNPDNTRPLPDPEDITILPSHRHRTL